ncbi:HAD family hydrolase [Micromonospora echinospora]|uniref:Haloacid dehalogenase superfamily, subfamily IA, variant 3 with third motif having DD or ED/haloacid dehalogenase superfamily, subfamily IA, variant 1 with third motif having Dx(3-4)D or Dx(3-4)E n=1 Tax=Micromonospora echinospora TaxID=1877 RepID=A0A1C5A958_MICEC|nr:HAD family hydrolase [Micromonospora echinospora]OZV78829.1 HAD family hydrolase [Micromonospora echinospora]SCF41740.1 haloacid dehalogenase superfamily, subfamily IA, variant 3 with third motif having DD or ED/haloacid dehalogenase superfamily, subfamily IA, variant 1 with third motif having Dx(3-4)D or Dx(3-4)E [Micromonospora echinospora]
MAARSDGVLFDVDGTLVDTTYLHTVAWWEALRQFDHAVPMALIHRSIGMGSDRLLDHLLGPERDRASDDRLRDAHDSLFLEYADRLTPLPHAADLLRACADRGLRVVLATSAAEHEVRALRAALDADDAVDTVTSSADAQQGKPAPDILVAALEQSGLAAERVVFVGDSVWDVAAAGRLGIPCIGLTCGGTGRAELAGAGAVEVYDDPGALLAHLADSPVLGRRHHDTEADMNVKA